MVLLRIFRHTTPSTSIKRTFQKLWWSEWISETSAHSHLPTIRTQTDGASHQAAHQAAPTQNPPHLHLRILLPRRPTRFAQRLRHPHPESSTGGRCHRQPVTAHVQRYGQADPCGSQSVGGRFCSEEYDARGCPATEHTRTIRNAHRDPHTTIILHADTQETVDVCTTLGTRLERLAFPPRASIDYIRRVYERVAPLLHPPTRPHTRRSTRTSSTRRSSRTTRTTRTTSRPTHHNKKPFGGASSVSPRPRPPLRIILSKHTSNRQDHDGTECARSLARTIVRTAVTNTEKQQFRVNNGCATDDEHRRFMDVPPHEWAYARSKGARWDDETQRYYVYVEPDNATERDTGAMYDMRGTDWVNLRGMFGVGRW